MTDFYLRQMFANRHTCPASDEKKMQRLVKYGLLFHANGIVHVHNAILVAHILSIINY